MTVRLAQAALALAVVIVPLAAYALSAEVRAEVGRVFAMLAAGDTAGLRAYVLAYGAWAPAVSIGLMVLQALAAPVPHFVVIFANGLAFGVAEGWLLSLIGQTVAASVCFAIARGLGRAPVEALVGRFGLELADRWFARWGIAGIFATRLVPGVGFDAISYASGLTGIGYGRFALVTVVGSAPQTFLYAYLGQAAPTYAWVPLLATVVVGCGVGVMVLIRWRLARARAHQGPAGSRIEETLASGIRR
jgi:uncharacterized membrane protein YdjX (TVP38/TMEM64 family)